MTTQAKTVLVQQSGKSLPKLYDHWLLIVTSCLLAIGLLMVASSSIVISYRGHGSPFYFLIRQVAFLGLGIFLGIFITRIPISIWQRISGWVLLLTLILLLLVLVPGIGRQVNGSLRWIGVGSFGMQISELVKLGVLLYLAGYLVRQRDHIKVEISSFIKPLLLLAVISALLLKEPDFGACVVIAFTAFGLMFLAGVRLSHFALLLLIALIAMAALAVASPYRVMRLTTFLNPWAHAFQSGYQLTQSLIAFGRGGWFGVGLGGSVQKLFYLPEAHTDFIFAVMAEELGLVGLLAIIMLFIFLITRIFMIARAAELIGEYYAALVAYGVGLWIALQVIINIGVNTGVLPTKGLTLPFISYGGSSLLIMCMTMAVLIRIDHETRLLVYGFNRDKRK